MLSENYPQSDIFERAYLLKIYHNQKIRESELPSLLPQVFLNNKRRLVAFLMVELYHQSQEITVSNMVLLLSNPSDRILSFVRKNFGTKYGQESSAFLNENEITDILFDETVDTSDKLFDAAKRHVYNLCFGRFVDVAISDIKYYNSYYDTKYRARILAGAKAIIKYNDVLQQKSKERVNHLEDAKNRINDLDEYITTSSQVLNSYIGGFSRGYVNNIFAQSGHCKSSWVDFNNLHTIASKKIEGKIIKITPEEDVETQYKRIISMICKVSTTSMKTKTVRITDDHLNIVKEKLNNQLVIYDNLFKLSEIMDLLSIINDADIIVIDHINGIDYPGSGTWLSNMIGGIPGLINFEKKIARKKNVFGRLPTIINLSQVTDKEIMKSDRLIKAPRYYDCYGSSMLYQVSRQMIGLWYPYKTMEDVPAIGTERWTINDVQLSVEKSSYSGMGKVMLNFNPEYTIFTDKTKLRKGLDYEPPTETKGLFG